jgi:hypothetical protein
MVRLTWHRDNSWSRCRLDATVFSIPSMFSLFFRTMVRRRLDELSMCDLFMLVWRSAGGADPSLVYVIATSSASASRLPRSTTYVLLCFPLTHPPPTSYQFRYRDSWFILSTILSPIAACRYNFHGGREVGVERVILWRLAFFKIPKI